MTAASPAWTDAGMPDPRQAGAFVFETCDYDPEQGVARLSYRFDNGPELIERVTFPHAPWPPEASRQAAFGRALDLLHLIAGVSYYKAGCSRRMHCERSVMTARRRAFLTDLYTGGLAEFGFHNAMDVGERICFPEAAPGSTQESPEAIPLVLPERALVAMGGGKDSLVGLDLMRRAGVEVLPTTVGASQLIGETVRAAGLPLLRIGRELAPELTAMNRAGAWNGHVPVTAINSAILLCAAILYGFRYVVFANERSADEATLVTAGGEAINHQYSKGSAFEAGLQAVLAAEVSPSLGYFSVLRPLSELGVLQRFSRMSEFHRVFSSCNRHFHLDGPRIESRWCGACPKCRFAALGLAMFLPPARVTAIIGADLLGDPAQESGFRELCRLGRDKPFECVGEAGESRAAMRCLGGRPEWSRHAIVLRLGPELDRVEVPSLDELLSPSNRHGIPPELFARLDFAGQPDVDA